MMSLEMSNLAKTEVEHFSCRVRNWHDTMSQVTLSKVMKKRLIDTKQNTTISNPNKTKLLNLIRTIFKIDIVI